MSASMMPLVTPWMSSTLNPPGYRLDNRMVGHSGSSRICLPSHPSQHVSTGLGDSAMQPGVLCDTDARALATPRCLRRHARYLDVFVGRRGSYPVEEHSLITHSNQRATHCLFRQVATDGTAVSRAVKKQAVANRAVANNAVSTRYRSRHWP